MVAWTASAYGAHHLRIGCSAGAYRAALSAQQAWLARLAGAARAGRAGAPAARYRSRLRRRCRHLSIAGVEDRHVRPANILSRRGQRAASQYAPVPALPVLGARLALPTV